jgi:hypothetical protein
MAEMFINFLSTIWMFLVKSSTVSRGQVSLAHLDDCSLESPGLFMKVEGFARSTFQRIQNACSNDKTTINGETITSIIFTFKAVAVRFRKHIVQ